MTINGNLRIALAIIGTLITIGGIIALSAVKLDRAASKVEVSNLKTRVTVIEQAQINYAEDMKDMKDKLDKIYDMMIDKK